MLNIVADVPGLGLAVVGREISSAYVTAVVGRDERVRSMNDENDGCVVGSKLFERGCQVES